MTRIRLTALAVVVIAGAAAAWSPAMARQSKPAEPPQGKGTAAAPAKAGNADKLVAEGRAAYEKAAYGEALIKFEEAVKAGASGGELFYQMGFCYRTVRDDQENARASMARALPLLDQQIKDASRRDLKSYYYLAAIRLNEIPEPDELSRLSKEAIRALESGALPKPVTGEELFQAGRLYGFSGNREQAVAHYEKAIAALEKAGPGKEGILRHCLEASADAAAQKEQWDKAAGLYTRLLKSDPSRDDVRMPLALTLFKAGREMDAIPHWRETRDPRLEGDKVYLERVARHYVELGRPQVQAPADNEELRKAIIEAAKAYAAARAKDDEAARVASEAWQEKALAERKARRKAKAAPAGPSIEELEKIPPEKLTAEQRLRLMGYTDIALEPPAPPPSPERLEAEKKFFGLLAVLVRRGQLVQDFAVTNGLAPLLFK
jgi:tetratricopeptide (TPR) repeat protein